MDSIINEIEGVLELDHRIISAVYWVLTVVASLQLVRTILSKSRRTWSLATAFLALCFSWTIFRAIYFTFVFAQSESCVGFQCSGGKNDKLDCNKDLLHPEAVAECSDGVCVSRSPLNCAVQHILFGVPTMIQSFMLSTLIVFYSHWCHKHKSNGSVYRQRVYMICGMCNLAYYACFFTWVFAFRCSESAATRNVIGKEIMAAVTACMFFVLCGALTHFSIKLYRASLARPAESGRGRIIWTNSLIVLLFLCHGLLALFSLSPDRQDTIRCPLHVVPDGIVILIGNTKAPVDNTNHSIHSEPSRLAERFAASSSDTEGSSDQEEDSQGSSRNSLGDFPHGIRPPLLEDLNRYEQTSQGVFQSSPCFHNTHLAPRAQVRISPSKVFRSLNFPPQNGMKAPLLEKDAT